MRLLFWNLGYARDIDGSVQGWGRGGHRLVRQSLRSQKRVLDTVGALIVTHDVDICALSEVNTGAHRTGYFSQPHYLADQLPQHNVVAASSKYASKVLGQMPFHKGNSNGVVAKDGAVVYDYHFSVGGKTLVQQVIYDDVTIFVVHLNLLAAKRRLQLMELATWVMATSGPVVVCGDFNTFGGESELEEFCQVTGMELVTTLSATFPATAPRLALDHILCRDVSALQVTAEVVVATGSDHLPILCSIADTKKTKKAAK